MGVIVMDAGNFVAETSNKRGGRGLDKPPAPP